MMKCFLLDSQPVAGEMKPESGTRRLHQTAVPSSSSSSSSSSFFFTPLSQCRLVNRWTTDSKQVGNINEHPSVGVLYQSPWSRCQAGALGNERRDSSTSAIAMATNDSSLPTSFDVVQCNLAEVIMVPTMPLFYEVSSEEATDSCFLFLCCTQIMKHPMFDLPRKTQRVST